MLNSLFVYFGDYAVSGLAFRSLACYYSDRLCFYM